MYPYTHTRFRDHFFSLDCICNLQLLIPVQILITLTKLQVKMKQHFIDVWEYKLNVSPTFTSRNIKERQTLVNE